MPISYEIDRARLIVFAHATGVVTPHDFFAYQKAIGARPECKRLHECIDMSEVTKIVDATEANMQALAALSVQCDDPVQPTKLAIFASESLHYGLARMYEAYRGMQPDNSRKVGIFRTRDEALRWLEEERSLP